MAFIDFADLKARISLQQAAQLLGLKLKPSGSQFRCQCPVHGGDNRSLAITPQKGWYCQQVKQGGDVIALVAHIRECSQREAAQELATHLGGGTVDSTSSSKRKGTSSPCTDQREERPQNASNFDPDAFAAKLAYTPEVEALGLSQEDAERIGVGWHPQRKAIYLGFRNPDGSWSGWMKFSEGELVMPPTWIATSVVPFRRRAQSW